MTGSDRIPYVTSREEVSDEGRHHFDSVAESRGSVQGPFSVLMNSPEVASRVGHLGAYIRFESELPDEIRELAILTTSRALDCPYEWVAHAPIARDAGVPDATIEAVATGADTDRLDDVEATVVSYGRELLYDHWVSDGTYGAALDRFGETGVVELTATVSYYAMLACVLNAFEVLPDEDAQSPDSPGAAGWTAGR